MSHIEHDATSSAEEQVALYKELVGFYRQRELLLKSIGTTDAEVIVSMVHSMEEQLKDLYTKGDSDHPDFSASAGASDAGTLSRELGTSNAEEIVSMVKNLEAQLHDFYAQGDQDSPDFKGVMNGSSGMLAEEIGTSDPEEILGMIRNMEEQLKDIYAERDSAHAPLL